MPRISYATVVNFRRVDYMYYARLISQISEYVKPLAFGLTYLSFTYLPPCFLLTYFLLTYLLIFYLLMYLFFTYLLTD